MTIEDNSPSSSRAAAPDAEREAGKWLKELAVFAVLAALVAAYWSVTAGISPFDPAFTPLSIIAAGLLAAFWLLFLYFVFYLLLGGVFTSFVGVLRRRVWARVLFPAYLAVHLVVYGYVLEKIIVLTSSRSLLTLGPQAYLMAIYYYRPHTIAEALASMTRNPGIFIILPPFYALVLGPFALFSAFLIGVLVVVHTDRLLRAAGRLRKAGGSVVYPAMGLVGGASCCVSLPDLAAYGSFFGATALSTGAWTTLLYYLYYFLPLTVIITFVATLLPSVTHGRTHDVRSGAD